MNIESFTYDRVAKLVRTTDGALLGTGSFVAPGVIVTARHNVEGIDESTIELHYRGSIASRNAARIVFGDSGLDLALVLTEFRDHGVFTIASELAPNDPVYSFGFTKKRPGGEPLTALYVGMAYGPDLLKFKTAQVTPGFSGAPLVSFGSGELSGIITVSIDPWSDLGGYAIPSPSITPSLKGAGIKFEILTRHHRERAHVSNPNALQGYLSFLRVEATRVPLHWSNKLLIDECDPSILYTPLFTDIEVDLKVRRGIIEKVTFNQRKDAGNVAPTFERQCQPSDFESIDPLALRFQAFLNLSIDFSYRIPGSRPLLLVPPWQDGLKKRFWSLSVLDAASLFKYIVILGAPGCGKSTVARHLTYVLSTSKVNGTQDIETEVLLEAWSHPQFVPIFIELGKLFRWKDFPTPGEDLSPAIIDRFIQSQLGESGTNNQKTGAALEAAYLGEAVFILDGLDEIPSGTDQKKQVQFNRQLSQLVNLMRQAYPDSRIIVTSRPHGFNRDLVPGFQVAAIRPLDSHQITSIASRLFERFASPTEVDHLLDEFMTALQSLHPALKDRPLFIVMLATIFLNSTPRALPTNQARLYDECINLLMLKWARTDENGQSLLSYIGCSKDELFKRLAKLAYDTQVELHRTTGGEINYSHLLLELCRATTQVHPSKVIEYLTREAGILLSEGPEEFKFAHRSFREYLAGLHVLDSYGVDSLTTLYSTDPVVWLEPTLLAAQILAQRGEFDALGHLAASLIGSADVHPEDSEVLKGQKVWLASEIIIGRQASSPHQDRRWVLPLEEKLKGRIKSIFSSSVSLAPAYRSDLGAHLDTLGDDRAGVGLTDGLPSLLWHNVPEGDAVIGLSESDVEFLLLQRWCTRRRFDRETPQTTVPVPEFDISVFPITEAQFSAFVQDPEGYSSEVWWLDYGKEWFQSNGRLGPAIFPRKLHNCPRTSHNPA